MYTYIREQHKGYYIETNELIDAEYWAGQIGTTYEDFLNGMWVLLSDDQVAFHEEYPEASVKEVLDMQLTPVPPRTLEQAKTEKIAELEAYNDSENVNQFYVVKDGVTVTDWLTPEKRSNYRNSIDAAKLVGLASLSLYVGGMPVTLPTYIAEQMLAQVQLYADQCFIVTEQHNANIEALESVMAVDGYDIAKGYPEKPVFNLDILMQQQEEPEEEEAV